MKNTKRTEAEHVLRFKPRNIGPRVDPLTRFNKNAAELQQLGGRMKKLLTELRDVSISEQVLVAAYLMDHTMQHVQAIQPITYKQHMSQQVNPFKKGDKVKMTAHAIATGLDTAGGPQELPSSRTGEVVTNPRKPDLIRVRRDGRQESRMYHISFWEHITSNHETQ